MVQNVLDLINASLPELEKQIRWSAFDLALLGAIDHSRKLLDLFLESGIVSPTDTYRLYARLNFAWAYTNTWPEHLPESERQLDNLRETYEGSWGSVPAEGRTYDQNGLDHCLTLLAPSPASARTYGISLYPAMVKALDISLRIHRPDLDQVHKLDDLDDQSVNLLKRITESPTGPWGEPPSLGEDLLLCERLWPLYARGILAEARGLRTYDLSSRGSELIAAAMERLQHPYAPTRFADKSIAQLLEISNRNSMSELGPTQTSWPKTFPVPFTTLFRDPATPQKVWETELRLGVQLPDDYKIFFACSDGFRAPPDDPHADHGCYPGPNIFNLDRLNWDRSYGGDLVPPVQPFDCGRLIYEIAGTQRWKDTTEKEFFDMNQDLPGFDKVLVISVNDLGSVLLLPPEETRRVADAWMQFYDLAEGEWKAGFKRGIESFAGSIEEFRDPGWWCFEGSEPDVQGFRSFKRWLEEQVVRSFSAM